MVSAVLLKSSSLSASLMQMMKLCVRLPACVVSCQTQPQDCMRQRDGKPVSVQRINNATGGVQERKTCSS